MRKKFRHGLQYLSYRGKLAYSCFKGSQNRKLPSVYIVGTQKGGTTSCFSHLSRHSLFAEPLQKEIQFFQDPKRRRKGLSWYLAHFPFEKEDGSLTGEASTFMYSEHVPRLLSEFNSEAKLIFLLRDPSERAISHYYHNLRRPGRESLSIDEAFYNEESRIEDSRRSSLKDEWFDDEINRCYSYLARGDYAKQLRLWSKFFPREQMLLVESESFFSNTQVVMEQVFSFLGLKSEVFDFGSRLNSGSYSVRLQGKLEKFLLERYKSGVRALADEFEFMPSWASRYLD